MDLLTLDDIPNNGFILSENEVQPFLDEQDNFYSAYGRKNVSGLAGTLDRFVSRIVKLACTKVEQLIDKKIISFKDTTTPNAMAGRLGDVFAEEAMEAFWLDEIKILLGIYNVWHKIAKGVSSKTESKYREDQPQLLIDVEAAFKSVKSTFERWFNNPKNSNLFIEKELWDIRRKYDVFSNQLTQDTADNTTVLEEFFELTDDELSYLSTRSLLAFVRQLELNEEFSEAIKVLDRINSTVHHDAELNYEIFKLSGDIHTRQKNFRSALECYEKALEQTEKSGAWDRRYVEVQSDVIYSSLCAHKRVLERDIYDQYIASATLFTPHMELQSMRIKLIVDTLLDEENNSDDVIKEAISELIQNSTSTLSPSDLIVFYESVLESLPYFLKEEKCEVLSHFLLTKVFQSCNKYHRWDELTHHLPSLIDYESNPNLKIQYESAYNDAMTELNALNEIIENSTKIFYSSASMAEKNDAKEKLTQYYNAAVTMNYTVAIEEIRLASCWNVGKRSDWILVDDFKGNWAKLFRLKSKLKDWQFNEGEDNSALLTAVEDTKNVARDIGSDIAMSFVLYDITSRKSHYDDEGKRLNDLNLFLEILKPTGSKRLTAITYGRLSRLYRHTGKDELAIKYKTLEMQCYAEYYPRNMIWAFVDYLHWLDQDGNHQQAIKIIPEFRESRQFDEDDLFRVNMFEAYCILHMDDPTQWVHAQQTLARLTQLIMKKQWINEKNYGTYQQSIATHILSCIMLDDKEALEEILQLLDKSDLFYSSDSYHGALGTLMKITEGEMSDGLIEYFYHKAELDFKQNEFENGLLTIFKLSKYMREMEHSKANQHLSQCLEMSIEKEAFSFVQECLRLLEKMDSDQVFGIYKPLEDKLESFYSTNDIKTKQLARYYQFKAGMTSNPNLQLELYQLSFKFFNEAEDRRAASMILDRICKCGGENEHFLQKLSYDQEHSIAMGLLSCLNILPEKFPLGEAIPAMRHLSKILGDNDAEVSYFFRIMNTTFRGYWKEQETNALEKIQILQGNYSVFEPNWREHVSFLWQLEFASAYFDVHDYEHCNKSLNACWSIVQNNPSMFNDYPACGYFFKVLQSIWAVDDDLGQENGKSNQELLVAINKKLTGYRFSKLRNTIQGIIRLIESKYSDSPERSFNEILTIKNTEVDQQIKSLDDWYEKISNAEQPMYLSLNKKFRSIDGFDLSARAKIHLIQLYIGQIKTKSTENTTKSFAAEIRSANAKIEHLKKNLSPSEAELINSSGANELEVFRVSGYTNAAIKSFFSSSDGLKDETAVEIFYELGGYSDLKKFKLAKKMFSESKQFANIMFKVAVRFHQENNLNQARNFYSYALNENKSIYRNTTILYRLAIISSENNVEDPLYSLHSAITDASKSNEEKAFLRQHVAIFHLIVNQDRDAADAIFRLVYEIDGEFGIYLGGDLTKCKQGHTFISSEGEELFIPHVGKNKLKKFQRLDECNKICIIFEDNEGINHFRSPCSHSPHIIPLTKTD